MAHGHRILLLCLIAVWGQHSSAQAPQVRLMEASNLIKQTVRTIVSSHDGSFVVVGSEGRSAIRFTPGVWSQRKRLWLGGSTTPIFTGCVTADDRYFVMYSSNAKVVRVTDVNSGLHLAKISSQFVVRHVMSHPKQPYVFLVGQSNLIKKVAVPDAKLVDEAKTEFDKIIALTAFPDGERMLIGGYDEATDQTTIEIRDTQTMRVARKLGTLQGRGESFAISDSQNLVAIGGTGGQLKVLSIDGTQLFARPKTAQPTQIRSLQIVDDRWLWIPQNKRQLELMDLRTMQIHTPHPDLKNVVTTLVLPKSNTLLVGRTKGNGATFSIWKLISSGSGTPTQKSMPVAASIHSGKLDPPTPEQQSESRRLIGDIMRDSASPRLSASEAKKVADTLWTAANDEPDASNRYVCLVESARLSTTAGNAEMARRALAAIDKEWRVDVAAQSAALLKTSINISMPTTSRRVWSRWAIELSDNYESDHEYAKAVAFSDLARSIAEKTRDSELVAQTTKSAARLRTAAVDYKRESSLLERIRKSPDDPTTNHELGIYRCSKGEWTAGLTNLAKSSVVDVQLAASSDITNPSEPSKILELAKKWADVGSVGQTEELTSIATASANYWYAKAIGKLSGLSKLKAERAKESLPACSLQRK